MLALTAAMVILGSSVGASHAPAAVAQTARNESGAGTIAFFVNRCSADKEAVDDSVVVTIFHQDGSVAVRQSFAWHGRDPSPLQWFVSVPAGVYRYSLWGNQGQYCTTGGYVAVLPGSLRPVTGTMGPHVTVTFLVPVYIYGLAPLGYTILVVRTPDSARCNSNISEAQMTFVDQFDRDTVGYYARAAANEHSFGVRVEGAPNDARTFRISIAGEQPSDRGQPTGIRFDITPAMIEAAFRRPAGTLICQ